MSFNNGYGQGAMPFGQLPQTPDLKKKTAVKPESARALERKSQQISQTQQQLQELMQGRITSPNTSQSEMLASQKKMADMQQMLDTLVKDRENLKRKVEQDQTLINQQQITIKNQSQVIANPRPSFTPALGFGSYGPPAQFAASAAPVTQAQNKTSYNAPAQPSVFGQKQLIRHNTPAPLNLSQAITTRAQEGSGHPRSAKVVANEYGSPEQLDRVPPPSFNLNRAQSSSSSAGFGVRPMRSSDAVYKPPTPASNPMLQDSPSTSVDDPEVKALFENVFGLCQQFAINHANFPSTFKDQQLPQQLKDLLINAATQHTAFNLINKPETRYRLVSKVIVQWLIKEVFKPTMWKGFNHQVDKTIHEAKSQIYGSTPTALRYLHLKNIGNHLRGLQVQPNFQPYLNTTIKDRANDLFNMIKPLMHHKTPNDWQHMHFLVHEAHRLAEKMFLHGAMEYSFQFPSFNAPFRPDMMVSCDPAPSVMTVDELVKRRASVRFSIFPAVHVRENTYDGYVRSGLVVPAQVMLKMS